jgi:hypothetical protein
MEELNNNPAMPQVMELLKHFGEFAFQKGFNLQFSLNERNDWILQFVNTTDGKTLNFDNKIMEFRAKTSDEAATGLAKQFLSIINQENEAKQELLSKGKNLNLVS